MINLDSVLKSKDVTLPTKVHMVKVMVFPVVTYGYESWTLKKAQCQRIDSFKLWCWIRLLRVPWTARRSNQSILQEISPEYSLEGLMLKLQYFGHLMQTADSLEKTLMREKIKSRRRRWDRRCWRRQKEDWRQEEKMLTEDKMVGWHHWFNRHELGQTLGDGEGQGSLVCCSPCGCEESNTTWQLNNNNTNLSRYLRSAFTLIAPCLLPPCSTIYDG